MAGQSLTLSGGKTMDWKALLNATSTWLASFSRRGPSAVRRKLNLGAIMLPAEPAFTNLQYIYDWKKLSDAEIDRRIRDTVAAAGSNRAIMGYFVTDEPGAGDFPALAKAVAAVKKYAPGKLAYINLFPDYATLGAKDNSQLGTSTYTEYLERFVSEVHPQFISYDNYMVEYSHRPQEAGARRRVIIAICSKCAASRSNIICLISTLSRANQIHAANHHPLPGQPCVPSLSTTLAAGYRGVNPGTHIIRKVTNMRPSIWRGEKTADLGLAAGNQSRGMMGIAPIMSRLESTGVLLHRAPAPGGQSTAAARKTVSSHPPSCATPLMIGEFQGRRMVQPWSSWW